MRCRKVLLLVPRYEESRYRPVLQTGVGYLAEALSGAGIECRFLDMGFFGSRRHLKALLRDFDPDAVTLSMLTFRYKDHYMLARRIKDLSRRVMVCAGGPHVPLFGKKVLEECEAVDVAFKGEGERALVDLCLGKDPSGIKGLIYKDGNVLRDTGEPDAICDLDNIAFPRYEKFPLARYIDKQFNILPIITSRGCPCRCTYCPVHLSMGYTFRMRSAVSIVDEIEYWAKRGYYRFGISDDNFTFNRERVVKMCEEIKKRSLDGLKLSCDNGIRADRVDFELLKTMREAGFWRIAYGVEAGNDKILSGIDKDLNIATVEKAIREACGLGYTVRLFFLIGSPGETWGDFEDSIRLAKRYPVFDASFYNVIPYPGTGLFSWIEAHGRFLDTPENYLHYATGKINIPVFSTDGFGCRKRRRAFSYARKVSLGIARKALRRRLKRFGLAGRIAAEFYGLSWVNSLLEWKSSRSLLLAFMRDMIDDVLEEEKTPSRAAAVRDHYAFSERPRVSVIIPSLDGIRGGNVARLIGDFKAQTFVDFEINVIKNVSPQGKAINLGAAKARGEILLIADDDSRLGNPHVIENLVRTLDENKAVGMAGASITVPPDANWLQKRAASEFPRFGMKVVAATTESDMACHGCCVIPRRVFEEVGRERENILRGLDPDLRVRMRKKGYKTVIVANTWVYHPLPGTLAKLIKTFFRNGMGSAYCLKYQPELIYDTDETLELRSFKARIPFVSRVFRFPVRIVKALAEFKFLRFIAYLVYAVGFYYGMVKYSVEKK